MRVISTPGSLQRSVNRRRNSAMSLPVWPMRPVAELCRMLAEITPGDLVKSFLSCGGGVANENAIKIAKAYTGRPKIISRWRSFHGATYGAMAITGDPRRLANEPTIPGSFASGILFVIDAFLVRLTRNATSSVRIRFGK